MADNLFLVEEPTNLDLLMNAINWLRGQAELGGIAPKSHVALTLAADPVLRTRLVLVPTVMAVAAHHRPGIDHLHGAPRVSARL